MGHAARRWTAAEYFSLPEDDRRIELIDGRLVITPAASPRHEETVVNLVASLFQPVRGLGGKVFASNLAVAIDDDDVLLPDVQLFLPQHLDRVGARWVEGPPDLTVEISSPSTKGRDRLRKRALYERFGVAEFWIVDLDEDVIEVYRLGSGGASPDGYGPPARLARGDAITSPLLPGWSAEIDWLLPARE